MEAEGRTLFFLIIATNAHPPVSFFSDVLSAVIGSSTFVSCVITALVNAVILCNRFPTICLSRYLG